MDKVYGFFEENRYLSNFWRAPVVYDGDTYCSNEAAFQAAKCADRRLRTPFLTAPPNEAKRLGRRVQLRPDWERIKIGVMTDIVRDKFTRNPDLREKLVATGNAELVEANGWHDVFWGVDEKTGRGENHLGRILMQVRDELRG